jgi:5-methylcytosine-specific restriction enzyme A
MPYGSRSARTVPLPSDWPAIRRRILARDGHQCTWTTDGIRCIAVATDVDHIGDPNDHSDDNLRSLCGSHHRRRSSSQGARAWHAKRKPRQRPVEQHPGLIT